MAAAAATGRPQHADRFLARLEKPGGFNSTIILDPDWDDVNHEPLTSEGLDYLGEHPCVSRT